MDDASAGASSNHDIVVVGGSAGGFPALQRIFADLPSGLPASILVVLHMGATSQLGPILDRCGPMPVTTAANGMTLERGRAYVAVPNHHLLVHDGHILLRKGPRENLSRPAIDPLFRSAAASFGGRVIGVVLSGSLNDGTAGLRAVKCCGGLAVVQDPGEALAADMPRSALRYVEVDHVASSGELGKLLARLVREPAGETRETPLDIRLEAAIAAEERVGMSTEDELGELAPFTCPECKGTLWELADGEMLRYRCHTGHAFTADTMLQMQSREVEQILGTLLRTHQERAELARRLAEKEDKHNRSLRDHLAQRARDYANDADVIRRLLLERGAAPDQDSG
jgi:two-component system, chemotaxis family, protein-glutamate methylesterase/glutaminase